MDEVHYLMTQKQLNRYKVICMANEGSVTVSEAAVSLDLSERQIKRLKKGVSTEGPGFLIHSNKDRKPIHAVSEELAQKIIDLKNSENYKNANFSHFNELLEEREGINISYSTLYRILTTTGINSPKKRRKPKTHHRRKRKPKEGLLLQLDATPFEWFGSNEKFALHGAIDDATGKITGLYLTKNECLQGYFEIARQTILNFGIPASVYSDRHSIFRSPNADKLSIEEQLAGKAANQTQFSRALSELGTTLIPARSPQAKGRIERLWDTLQSRLPTAFKIAGVSTIDKANDFLVNYISGFNERFAAEPTIPEAAYRTLSNDTLLENVLCFKDIRSVDNGSVFSFSNKNFQIIFNNCVASIPPKSKVNVLLSPHFGVRAKFNDVVYEVVPFIKPKKSHVKEHKKQLSKAHKPPDDHYFKYGKKQWPKLMFEDSDRDIMRMLEDIFLSKHA